MAFLVPQVPLSSGTEEVGWRSLPRSRHFGTLPLCHFASVHSSLACMWGVGLLMGESIPGGGAGTRMGTRGESVWLQLLPSPVG